MNLFQEFRLWWATNCFWWVRWNSTLCNRRYNWIWRRFWSSQRIWICLWGSWGNNSWSSRRRWRGSRNYCRRYTRCWRRRKRSSRAKGLWSRKTYYWNQKRRWKFRMWYLQESFQNVSGNFNFICYLEHIEFSFAFSRDWNDILQ